MLIDGEVNGQPSQHCGPLPTVFNNPQLLRITPPVTLTSCNPILPASFVAANFRSKRPTYGANRQPIGPRAGMRLSAYPRRFSLLVNRRGLLEPRDNHQAFDHRGFQRLLSGRLWKNQAELWPAGRLPESHKARQEYPASDGGEAQNAELSGGGLRRARSWPKKRQAESSGKRWPFM